MDINQLFDKIKYEKIEIGLFAPVQVNFSVSLLEHPKSRSSWMRDAEHIPSVCQYAFDDSTVMASVKSEMLYEKKIEIKKPDDIYTLEHLLSEAYDTRVEITSVNELPLTKKKVKEIHFLRMDEGWGLNHKVWVFKADPEKTLRELTIYYLASKNGIPTGKPIGFEPVISQKKYAHDIGIIGGVVEHAGNSYNELIHNMRLKPARIHDMAVSLASVIADTHSKLNLTEQEFEQYDIRINNHNVETELTNRFLAALSIDKNKAHDLIQACIFLYNKQHSDRVISHGDIHTGNIVTEEKISITNVRKFGLIDWDSINRDTPYGDLHDFWLHHTRQAVKACSDYSFNFEDIEKAYKHKCDEIGIGFYLNKTDSLIQSALWNLYEMYDPTRKDLGDVETKAVHHANALYLDLSHLEELSYKAITYKIKKELHHLLKDKEYLKL
jgi:thiamine kinase-like enzyme